MNDQVEVTNRTMLHRLRTRLATLSGSWVDEVDSVLWAYRTMPHSMMEETPFSLIYSSKVVILAKVAINTQRVAAFNQTQSDHACGEELDLLEESRMAALKNIEKAKCTAAYYFNRRV